MWPIIIICLFGTLGDCAKLADVPSPTAHHAFFLTGPGTPAVLIDGGMHARSTKTNIL